MPPRSDERESDLQRLVETIMTAHWDMAACQCWICTRGRAIGCRPRAGLDEMAMPVMDDKQYRDRQAD